MYSKTKSGLVYFMFGTAISIFTALLTAASTSEGISCLIAIASFLSLILILIGFGLMVAGRKEFGKEHSEFVAYAAIAIVLGIGIFVLGTILMFTAALSGVTTTNTSDQ
jgi:hypothetical protein